jgi:peptidoglycan/LPS O-acetylase OafA/YrhL
MDRRNVSLDTLRSLAIILVVNCHAATAFDPERLYALRGGGHGVDLFFVLSGWLLGHLLFTELKRTGTIDVRRFWLRRWMRTLPAYYAVLLYTFAWQGLGRGNGDLRWCYLCFGQNYLPQMPYFTISWSLCVEEHFYLAVAPLILALFAFPPCRPLLVPLLLAPTVCRWMGWYGNLDQTHVRWDQCAAGVLLAYACVYRPGLWSWLCRLAPALACAGLGVVGYDVAARLNPGAGLPGVPLLAWALAFAALVLLANSSDFWRRRARVPGLRYLAERSYAVYLLHIDALAVVRRLGASRLLEPLGGFSVPLAFVLTWAVSLALAEVLHRLVERPLIRARERFAASRAVVGPAAAGGAVPGPAPREAGWTAGEPRAVPAREVIPR